MVLAKKNSPCWILQDCVSSLKLEAEVNVSCKPLIDLLMKNRHKKFECFQLVYVFTKYWPYEALCRVYVKKISQSLSTMTCKIMVPFFSTRNRKIIFKHSWQMKFTQSLNYETD